MKKIAAIILILSLLSFTAALAESSMVVAVSGDTYVRSGPGLNYGSYGVLHRGEGLWYIYDIAWDDRGVAWYAVEWNGWVAWVSSMYTTIYWSEY